MTSVYKKVYVSTVGTPEIAAKEKAVLEREMYDAGIDEIEENGEKKYAVYYMGYAGNDDL
jgi:hypothetical protein